MAMISSTRALALLAGLLMFFALIGCGGGIERRASGAQRGAHGFSPKISLSWLVFLCRSVSSRNAYFNATVSVEGGESRVMLGKNGVTSKGIFSWGERRATGLTCIISS